MPKTANSLLVTAVAMLATAALAASAWAQSPPTRADFEAFVGYFTAGSATWQQNNDGAGEGDPSHWVRRHSADGDISKAEVVAVYPRGHCEGVTTIEYRWSPEEPMITSRSQTASGLSFGGTVEPLGHSRYRTLVEGTLPDGAELKMRDTTDLSVPELAATQAERWVDGAWVPLDAAAWRRVPSSAWCEAHWPS